jgi:hypothetical protein
MTLHGPVWYEIILIRAAYYNVDILFSLGLLMMTGIFWQVNTLKLRIVHPTFFTRIVKVAVKIVAWN